MNSENTEKLDNLVYVHESSTVQQGPELEPEAEADSGSESEVRKIGPRTVFIPLLYGFLYILIQVFALYIVIFVKSAPEILAQIEAGSLSKESFAQLMTPAVMNWGSILMAAIILPLFSFYLIRRAKKLPRTLMRERISLDKFLSSISMISLSLFLTQLWVILLATLAPHIPYIQAQLEYHEQLIELIMPEQGSLILMFFAVVILVPIAEELLFRGVMMGEFLIAMKAGWAIVLSALLFALFHGNFVQSSYVVFPGIMLGLGYYLSRNLLVPISMHMFYNFFGGFLPILLDVEKNQQGAVTYVLITYGIFILSGIYLIFSYIRKRRKRKAANLEELNG
ncbi:MAG: type II CAAX endopeptidase family protein [Eubacteriales bacterium]|nr:type II CAAX endopeptidase family protein [Eubacteriales bacterium]